MILEISGLVISSVALFAQGLEGFRNYLSRRKKKKAVAAKEESLSRQLEKAGPTVQSEYDRGIAMLGHAMATYKDKDAQIEILACKNKFLEKVLRTFNAVLYNDNGTNPLDYAALEGHTAEACAGVVRSLNKVVSKLSTVPERRLLRSTKRVISFTVELPNTKSTEGTIQLRATDPVSKLYKQVKKETGRSTIYDCNAWLKRSNGSDYKLLNRDQSLRDQGVENFSLVRFIPKDN